MLELARSGAEAKCVVEFHSGLSTSAPKDAKNIKGKVMVCLGAEDPIIPKEQRNTFVEEMRAGGVDWQMLLYAHAGHSFTNREIDARGYRGLFYHQSTDERTCRAMQGFFDEALGRV